MDLFPRMSEREEKVCGIIFVIVVSTGLITIIGGGLALIAWIISHLHWK